MHGLRMAFSHSTGHTWTVAQYFNVGWLTVRQRNMWGAIKHVCTDPPFLQPRPVRSPGASSVSRQHAPFGVLPPDRTIDV